MNQDKQDLLQVLASVISAKSGEVQTINLFYDEKSNPQIVATFKEYDDFNEAVSVYSEHIDLVKENENLKAMKKNLNSQIKDLINDRATIEADIKDLTKKYTKKAMEKFGSHLADILDERYGDGY